MRSHSVFVFLIVALAACGSGDDSVPDSRTLVVYVGSPSGEPGAVAVDDLFDGFTRETGIAVDARHGIASVLVDDMIGKRDDPPADVLFVTDVGDAWRAAEQGALRPLDASLVEAAVIRDPDGFWVAQSVSAATIVVNERALDGDKPASWDALVGDAMAGSLCLSSSRHATMRMLIAALIRDLGVRPAEILVRGWIDNLAVPVFDTDRDVLAAIERGECGAGIVAGEAARANDAMASAHVVEPQVLQADAMGVGRHARQPDAAARFISWMSLPENQERFATARHRVAAASVGPAVRQPAELAWLLEDARKLAERARYP